METKEKKTLISIGINVLIIFFAHMLQINLLIYGALILMTVIVFFSDEKLFIPIMLFYLPWSPVFKISPESTSFFTIVECLCLLKFFILNKYKTNLKTVMYIIALMCITCISKILFINDFSIDYVWFFLMLLFFALYSRNNGKNISFEKCVLFLNLGVITSCFAALYLMNFSHMLKYIDVYTWEDKNLTRLSGFYGDANFYSAQIILTITCNLIELLFKKENRVLVIIFTLIIVYCGMLSVSKSFIILLLLVFLIWFLTLLIMKKKIKLKLVITLSIIIIGIGIMYFGMFHNTIQMYLTRFEMTNDVNSLSTGRSDIMKNYLRFFWENPLMFFWGQGYTKILYLDFHNKASHNTIIQSIYQFGLIGVIFLIVWIKKISDCFKIKKNYTENINNKIINIMLVSMAIIGFFGPWLALDILFFNDFFYFLVLFFIANKYIKEKNGD